MTRKTRDAWRLFPLEEAHIVSPLISPLPPPPQTRTFDFEMLYSVKFGVSFSHVHCDYGQRDLETLIWQRDYDNRFSS